METDYASILWTWTSPSTSHGARWGSFCERSKLPSVMSQVIQPKICKAYHILRKALATNPVSETEQTTMAAAHQMSFNAVRDVIQDQLINRTRLCGLHHHVLSTPKSWREMASPIPSTEVRNWRENLRSMRGLAFLWSQQIWGIVSPIAWYLVLAYPSQIQWEMHIRWGAQTSMKMWPFFFVVQSRRHTESQILFIGLPQLMIWSCAWMTSSHLISWGSWPSFFLVMLTWWRVRRQDALCCL